MLNGQKFYFAGTNAFYAGSTDMTSDDQIRELFKVQSANGAKVVRTWAYVNGYGGGSVSATAHPIQPSIGEPTYLMHPPVTVTETDSLSGFCCCSVFAEQLHNLWSVLTMLHLQTADRLTPLK